MLSQQSFPYILCHFHIAPFIRLFFSQSFNLCSNTSFLFRFWRSEQLPFGFCPRLSIFVQYFYLLLPGLWNLAIRSELCLNNKFTIHKEMSQLQLYSILNVSCKRCGIKNCMFVKQTAPSRKLFTRIY